jgi:hypothetical protein
MTILLALALLSEPMSIDYCERLSQHMWGLEPCTMVEDLALIPDLEELNFCCGWDGAPCVEVALGLGCSDGEYLVICENGVNNADGSITCYDDE